MSIELDRRAIDAHALRVAFGAPLAFALALWMGAQLPFIAPITLLTLGAGMRVPPKMKTLALALAALWLAPAVIAKFSSILVVYPYMLLGFVGLLLFHGMRMQARANTRPAGALLTMFGLVTPLVTDASQLAGAYLNDVLFVNGLCAIIAIMIGFTLFPHPHGASATTGAPLAPDAADATLHGLVGALTMLPLIAFFLSFDLLTAMRVLFVAAAIVGAVNHSELRRQGWIAIAGLGFGAIVALFVSAMTALWQAHIYAIALMLIASLIAARRMVEGEQAPLYVSGMSAAWAMLATTDAQPAARIVEFAIYAACGIGWALGVRELIMSLIERRKGVAASP